MGIKQNHTNEFKAKVVMAAMREMGFFGACPGPHTSQSHREHLVYPY